MPSDTATDAGDALLTPDSFVDIARRIQLEQPIHAGTTDDGFVFGSRFGDWTADGEVRCGRALVGLRCDGDLFVVAKLRRRTSVIGRNDPRLKVRENTSVEGDVRHVELAKPDDPEHVDYRFEHTDSDARIDRGYVNGYRVRPLAPVIDEAFRWCADAGGGGSAE